MFACVLLITALAGHSASAVAAVEAAAAVARTRAFTITAKLFGADEAAGLGAMSDVTVISPACHFSSLHDIAKFWKPVSLNCALILYISQVAVRCPVSDCSLEFYASLRCDHSSASSLKL